MKKMMKMAIAATMVMTMSANAMASETQPANPIEIAEVMNNKHIGNQTETRNVVYDKGEYINKFEYVIDQNGTVISKTQYRNNHRDNQWMPICSYYASYGEDANRITFAAWNEETQSFSNRAKTTSYDKEECPVLIALPDIIDY